eukprot:scaffold30468_cov30-Attheya_sp.AAC.2
MPLLELDSLFRGQKRNNDALTIFSHNGTSASAATVVGFCRLDRVFYCMTCRQRLEVSGTAERESNSLFRGQQLNGDVSNFYLTMCDDSGFAGN